MRCNYCDAEISINLIKCPNCGRPLQIVPDYNPLDDILSEQINFDDTGYTRKQNYVIPAQTAAAGTVAAAKQSSKNQNRKNSNSSRSSNSSRNGNSSKSGSNPRNSSNRPQLTEREKMRRKKARMRELKRRRRRLILSMLLVFILIVTTVGLCIYNFSYSGIVSKGNRALNSNEYDLATTRFQSAIAKNPSRAEAYKGLAGTYLKQNQKDAAENVYLKATEKGDASVAIYDAFIQFYIETEQQEKIPALINSVEDSMRNKLSSYIVSLPEFSLDENSTYDEVQELSLTAEDGYTIYYTDNGRDPSVKSKEYTEAILLEEGTTTIKAITVDSRGIPSDVATKIYKIELPIEDAPAVSPSTGQYLVETDIEIKVPEGYTAYYTLDGTEPTTSSTFYYGPVRMPVGETIFKAILVSKSGKISGVTTRNYVYDRQ